MDRLKGERAHRGWLRVATIGAAIAALGAGPSAYAWAAGDVNQAACDPSTEASSGFRSYMPDCRAYEMVTPPFKGGAKVTLLTKAIAADGSRLIATSFGGFAGIENNEQGQSAIGAGVYELSRSPSGWLAEPLQPSATEVSHSSYVAASEDLRRSLWELIEGSSPEAELLNATTRYALALRVDGQGSPPSFVSIGPENPRSQRFDRRDFRFEGASADLSHIVFSIEAHGDDVWPGDMTEQGEGFQSLYEYVGTGNSEPTLVGVKNAGRLEGSPYVNEGAELIGACGTSLGFPFASSYNAVSATGETVFFTVMACGSGPPVNTLYARVSQEHTVAISQPQRPISPQQGNGSGPQECDAACEAAPPAEAIFQGAAKDGSKVFFTTTQSLLNGDEAGEGSGNDLYEAQLEGAQLKRLVQVSRDAGGAANVLGVARISEDGRRVYFVAEGVLSGANSEGKAPASRQPNLYLYETEGETTAFVATLSPQDAEDWKTEDRRPVQATPTGRLLAFPSVERLTGSEDRSTVSQLFAYDAESRHLARVSIGQQSNAGYFCPETNQVEAGYDCNGNVTNPRLAPVMPAAVYIEGTPPTEASSKLAVTEDGRVFFTSLDSLTPGAEAESKNIYEYDEGNVYLIAAGEDQQLEYAAFQESFLEHDRLVSTDLSGSDVFFGAVGQLVAQDTDSQADVYDARVEGGFPAPAAASECEGEACRPPSSGPPTLTSPPSAALPGEAPVSRQPAAPTKAKRPSRAQRLAHALRACAKKQPKRKRHSCRAAARKRHQREASGRRAR
jgi:hypothetical protein